MGVALIAFAGFLFLLGCVSRAERKKTKKKITEKTKKHTRDFLFGVTTFCLPLAQLCERFIRYDRIISNMIWYDMRLYIHIWWWWWWDIAQWIECRIRPEQCGRSNVCARAPPRTRPLRSAMAQLGRLFQGKYHIKILNISALYFPKFKEDFWFPLYFPCSFFFSSSTSLYYFLQVFQFCHS